MTGMTVMFSNFFLYYFHIKVKWNEARSGRRYGKFTFCFPKFHLHAFFLIIYYLSNIVSMLNNDLRVPISMTVWKCQFCVYIIGSYNPRHLNNLLATTSYVWLSHGPTSILIDCSIEKSLLFWMSSIYI